MVSVEVVFFLLFFFLAVEVVAVFWANTTVPVSRERPIAAIMSFFILINPSLCELNSTLVLLSIVAEIV